MKFDHFISKFKTILEEVTVHLNSIILMAFCLFTLIYVQSEKNLKLKDMQNYSFNLLNFNF